MTINEIQNSFYNNKKQTAEQAAVDLQRDDIMDQIGGFGLPVDVFLQLEAKINALCNGVEAESFADGFGAGIEHITQALRFAHMRTAG